MSSAIVPLMVTGSVTSKPLKVGADDGRKTTLLTEGARKMTDREKLIELLKGTPDVWMSDKSSEMLADHLISNGVTVRERGRWEQVDHDGSWRVDRCSICHRRMHYVDYDQPYQYCPNCGAKMDGDGNG